MCANLDTFVRSSRPRPEPIATSQEIRDRGSTFVAYAYRACSPREAGEVLKHVKHVVHGAKRATHEISAWRCMVLKPGQSGLSGPDDFELLSGSDDDGEKWAGEKILKVMQAESVLDAVIIVSRWYGGTMLGPARFAHIETCTQDVCRMFKRKDEMDECLATLTSLDDILAQLRSRLEDLKPIRETDSTATPGPGPSTSGATPQSQPQFTSRNDRSTKRPDYTAMINAQDVSKAKRLIGAREKSIQSVKNLIAKATRLSDRGSSSADGT